MNAVLTLPDLLRRICHKGLDAQRGLTRNGGDSRSLVKIAPTTGTSYAVSLRGLVKSIMLEAICTGTSYCSTTPGN